MRAIQLSEAGVKKGEGVQLCGLTQELRLMRRSSRVTSASHALKAGVPSVPRFRPVHEEVTPLLPLRLLFHKAAFVVCLLGVFVKYTKTSLCFSAVIMRAS